MPGQREENGPGERHGHIIEVMYGDTVFNLKPGAHDVAELAAIFSIPAGYVLDFINDTGGFEDLNPSQKIVIKDGMKFASHPPVGTSS
jgi:hypothetical protein